MDGSYSTTRIICPVNSTKDQLFSGEEGCCCSLYHIFLAGTKKEKKWTSAGLAIRTGTAPTNTATAAAATTTAYRNGDPCTSIMLDSSQDNFLSQGAVLRLYFFF